MQAGIVRCKVASVWSDKRSCESVTWIILRQALTAHSLKAIPFIFSIGNDGDDDDVEEKEMIETDMEEKVVMMMWKRRCPARNALVAENEADDHYTAHTTH